MSRDPVNMPKGLDSPIAETKLRTPQDDLVLDTLGDISTAGRGVDLSFLSANFSSESLDITAESPSTPARTSNFAHIYPQVPFHNRKYSNNSTPILGSSPVGQQSFSQHQRANSSSGGSRLRPRSIFGVEALNNAIWEDGPPKGDAKYNNRHSTHFGTKLTPLAAPMEAHKGHLRSASPVRSTSPVRLGSTSPVRISNNSPSRRGSSPSRDPFNFKLQDLLMTHGNSSNLLIVKPAHRKGHRYKHSSVSMNLFQEPVPISDANLQQDLIPDLYPIPNFKESLTSASSSQKFKLFLSSAHFTVAVFVFLVGVQCHQPAFSTLAHLVFYDSLGSLVVACVDIASNFEVWSKSSIAYPFGLGRLEVLMGFALSASLVMVGCDLVSHFVEELVVSFVDSSEDAIEHGAHHIHGSATESVNWILYEVCLFTVIVITWITSKFIFDGGSLAKMLTETDVMLVTAALSKGRKGGILSETKQDDASFWALTKSVLHVLIKNPIRLLTLVYSVFLMFVPLFYSRERIFDVTEMSTLVVAATLCFAGWSLVKTLGGILLISFPYSDYDYNVLRSSITQNILGLPHFRNSYLIDSVFVTKVNYQLYIACMGVTMKGGSADDESRLLFEINRIFETSIAEFDASSKVETTISINRA